MESIEVFTGDEAGRRRPSLPGAYSEKQTVSVEAGSSNTLQFKFAQFDPAVLQGKYSATLRITV